MAAQVISNNVTDNNSDISYDISLEITINIYLCIIFIIDSFFCHEQCGYIVHFVCRNG